MRSGDKPERAYFGAKRFFNVEGEWYFATREVCDQGPYQTQELAEAELAAYLGWCRKFAIGRIPWNRNLQCKSVAISVYDNGFSNDYRYFDNYLFTRAKN